MSLKGTCLCEAITLNTSSLNKNIGACHCGMCRKWAAGPFLAIDCGQDVKIEGKENLGVFDSSQWAERGFCKKCGTILFYRLKEKQQYIVSSEIFNEPNLKLEHQVFIDKKPEYYSFINKTKNMTEKEVFAMYSPSHG